MRITIIKSLVVFSVFAQVAIAQNAGTIDRFNNDIFGSDSTKLEAYVGQFGGTAPSKSSQATSVSRPMNQDSTNLIPNNIVIPVTNTYTAPTVVIPPQNGSCGASNGSIVTSSPTSFLCNIGVATGVTNNGGSYSWSCSGNNYGNPSNVASCSAQQRVVGQCGSDNGQTMSSTPTNLCTSGTASSVSSNGTSYSWSCNGNYGAPASCSASQQSLAVQVGAFCKGAPAAIYNPVTPGDYWGTFPAYIYVKGNGVASFSGNGNLIPYYKYSEALVFNSTPTNLTALLSGLSTFAGFGPDAWKIQYWFTDSKFVQIYNSTPFCIFTYGKQNGKDTVYVSDGKTTIQTY